MLKSSNGVVVVMAAAVASMVAGCSGPSGPSGPIGPTSPGPTVQVHEDCPRLGCGLNGSWLGENLPFRDLDRGPDRRSPQGRQANQAHLVIESFKKKNGDELGIDVDGDDLVGLERGDHELRGEKLIGTVITLAPDASRKASGHPEKYFLHIDDVTSTGFWTESCTFDPARRCTAADLAPLYTINFVKEGGNEKGNLCDPLIAPGEAVQGRVIIFRGDQYREPPPGAFRRPGLYRGPGYVVASDPASTWFNVACEGTAIAKLHLLRHTAASVFDPRPEVVATGPIVHPPRTTRISERQTLLKMLTADYCGIGFPFTENGHPLSYTFQQPWQPLFPRTDGSAVPFRGIDNASLDALWNQDGAVCLAVPRLSDTVARTRLENRIRTWCPAGARQAPGIEDLARPDLFAGAIGSVRRCGPGVTLDRWNLDLATWTHSYAVSANPRPFQVVDSP
ncbi:MAG TPA: ADYC domain-containing protein [Kofleriaceae bacterium]|nr:ADYC domain-containing protein [Kofleriaceae bacterium]